MTHRKPVIDVARCLLVGQRIVPYRGKTRIFLHPGAQLGIQLLACHKTHEMQIILHLQLGSIVQGSQQGGQLRTHILLPQPARKVLPVETVGREFGQYAKTIPGISHLAPCQQIAHPDGPQEKAGHGRNGKQSSGILGIEEHHVDVSGIAAELVLVECAIEDGLYGMHLLCHRLVCTGRIRHIFPLARLLLDNQAPAFLLIKKVESPLYAQHFAEKRRLQHHGLLAEAAHRGR